MPACIRCGTNCVHGDGYCRKCGQNLTEGASRQPAAACFPARGDIGAAARQEFGRIYLAGMQVSAAFAAAGIILFVLPWINIMWLSASGLDILLNAQQLTLNLLQILMLLAVPTACIATVWTYFCWRQQLLQLETAKKVVIICGGTAFVCLLALYLNVSSEAKGFLAFTGWFFLELLALLGIPGGILYARLR